MTDSPFEWSSKYLDRGFAQDALILHRWNVDEVTSFCEFSVEPGPDGANPFHLSALTSHRIVAQLGIDAICLKVGISKAELGEVYEIEHHVRYVREITKRSGIYVRVRAAKTGRTGRLVSTTFDYDVGDGSFVGQIGLGFIPKMAEVRGRLVVGEALDDYRRHYFSFYGNAEEEARRSPAVYSPKACVHFEPNASLVSELNDLAADMGSCILALHKAYISEGVSAASVSHRVPVECRPQSPTLIRLDVVEGPDGCRVVEINSGNCGGVETYVRMHSFLQGTGVLTGASPALLLNNFVDALQLKRRSEVEFVYVDEQSRFLSLVRATIFRKAVPGLTCKVTALSEFMRRRTTIASDTLIYRDFLHEELETIGDLGGEAEQFFLELSENDYFPSFADEYLSDKNRIAKIDERVRHGNDDVISGELEKKWLRRMTPSASIGHPPQTSLDFARPNGIVIKPADGFGGHGVTVLDCGTPPTNESFYRGHNLWVAQPFLETPLYDVTRANRRQKVRLVHGVFLMGSELQYAGTFSRLSPDRVVNIKNDGEVVYFAEKC